MVKDILYFKVNKLQKPTLKGDSFIERVEYYKQLSNYYDYWANYYHIENPIKKIKIKTI